MKHEKDEYYRIKGTDFLLVKSWITKGYRSVEGDHMVIVPDEFVEQVFTPGHETMWTDNKTGKNLIFNSETLWFVGLDSSVHFLDYLREPKRLRMRSDKDDFHIQLEGILHDNPGEPVTFVFDDGQITVEMYAGSDSEIRYATQSPGQGLEEVATDLFERDNLEVRLQRNPAQEW